MWATIKQFINQTIPTISTMKNLIAFCFLLAATAVFAQKDETMFSDLDRIGGWGAPIIEYTNYLGGYGMGTANFSLDNILGEESLKFKHGGFWIGYTPMQHKVVHPYTSVKLGWGKANYKLTGFDEKELDSERSSIFVTTPEVGLEVNVFSFFRIAATASYRWVNGFDPTGGFKSDDLSSFGATLTLRFGGFGDDDWDRD
jgi:hypothetical protein